MPTICTPAASLNSTRNAIHITSQDKQRLDDLLAEVDASNSRSRGDLLALTQELERAVVVDPHGVPNDVITMNSRAEMVDLESGEIVTFNLVFPPEANIDEGRISVLAPIGAGMLGYRLGDEVVWRVHQGGVRCGVSGVVYAAATAGGSDGLVYWPQDGRRASVRIRKSPSRCGRPCRRPTPATSTS